MNQQVNAIDAHIQTGWRGLILGIARLTRWEYTCGDCRSPVRGLEDQLRGWTVCPVCGSRNLLPMPRLPNDCGPTKPA